MARSPRGDAKQKNRIGAASNMIAAPLAWLVSFAVLFAGFYALAIILVIVPALLGIVDLRDFFSLGFAAFIAFAAGVVAFIIAVIPEGRTKTLAGASDSDRLGSPSCWVCGSEDAKGYTFEFGWYEHTVSDADTVEVQTDRYLRIGDETISLCPRCIEKNRDQEEKKGQAFLILILILGVIGLLFGLVFFEAEILQSIPPLLPLVDGAEAIMGDFRARSRFGPGEAIMGLVTLASALALIPGALLALAFAYWIVTWPFMRLLGKPQRRRNMRAANASFAHKWAAELGAAALERIHKDFDPFPLFNPNEPSNLGAMTAYDAASGRSHHDNRHRNYMAAGELRVDITYKIGRKRGEVDSWERKPLPREDEALSALKRMHRYGAEN